MGIDNVALETILLSQKYIKNNKTNACCLARQQFHISKNNINFFLSKYELYHLLDKYNNNEYFERFFKDLGFENIDSIDNSTYENANIIHNMNNPINITKKYQYIFDGGTIEHIYNIPQVCENIINLLDIGGVYCSVTVNNNFSGHGFYQFSPEFFLSVFRPKYGMELVKLYLAKTVSNFDSWIDVNDYNANTTGRNCANFNSSEPVYIIAIARKISDNRANLFTDSPNQYSYENIDWK
jgi:hypothetical protein